MVKVRSKTGFLLVLTPVVLILSTRDAKANDSAGHATASSASLTALEHVDLLTQRPPLRLLARVAPPPEEPASDVLLKFTLPREYAPLRNRRAVASGRALTSATAPAINRSLFKTCKELQLAPAVERVATITPGRPFQIDGVCFGDRLGTVVLSGGPGAGRRMSFTLWSDTKIQGVLERVHGQGDGQVELKVITGDGESSSPRIARFRAERETVIVPTERWAPWGEQAWATSDLPYPPSPNLWPDVQWNRPPPDLPSAFRVKLNPGCRLQSVGVDGTGVEFLSELGLTTNDSGEEGTATLSMRPVNVVRFGGMVGGLRVAPSYLQRGHYRISAEASCPVGVVP